MQENGVPVGHKIEDSTNSDKWKQAINANAANEMQTYLNSYLENQSDLN